MKNTTRIVLTLGVLAAAVASQAVTFNFIGNTASNFTPTTTSFVSTALLANTGIYNAITQGNVTLNGATSQVVFYVGTSTSNTGSLTISFDGTTDVSGTGGFSSAGTYVSSTGVLASTGGTGLQVTNNPNFNSNSTSFTVSGNVTPVPEPSAFAALGLGGLALLRRRRRA